MGSLAELVIIYITQTLHYRVIVLVCIKKSFSSKPLPDRMPVFTQVAELVDASIT